MKTFSVCVEIIVGARTAEEAEEHAADFMSYGFEVSNDEGRFKRWHLSESCAGETIEVGTGVESTELEATP